ncbi:MAG: YggT family protein [Clostridia bacterium]|nr:YggT family protein [Clostridia bacterium]
MPEPLYVLIRFAIVFIDAIVLAMSIRAILGWFFEPEGKLIHFLFVLTEPAIMPLRKLFAKMNWFQGSPIDMSYIFTYVALFLIQLFLESYLA